MQITDINDMISTAAQLLNAPDLILIAVLLANVLARCPTRTGRCAVRRDWPHRHDRRVCCRRQVHRTVYRAVGGRAGSRSAV